MDYRSVLFGPIYATWGVPAQLTLSSGTVFSGLTAIDMTTGVALPGAIEIETLRPAAVMLAGDLIDAGIDIDALDGATLTINGGAWNVNGTRNKPSPNGIADGEVYLLLEGSLG